MNILIVPVIAGKPWSGNTVLSEPLGGSEAAVAFLAQALQLRGHNVEVITHGGDQGKPDYTGVRYWGQDYYNPAVHSREWDAVISSRWPQIFDWPWRTKKRALWLHDMPSQNSFQVKADHVVFISEFQMKAYGAGREDPRVSIIGDGVDDELLKRVRPVERDPNKLVWCANPDRGLGVAARVFQEVRKHWPDLELHVYGRASVYGWDPSVETYFWPRVQDRSNVCFHDPLPRAQLFQVLASSWAYFYPTYWPETYCMATLEAQAVGLPVVCSPVGALPETVYGGIVSNDICNAISQLRNVRRWNKLSVAGIERGLDQTWAKQAERWEAMLTS